MAVQPTGNVPGAGGVPGGNTNAGAVRQPGTPGNTTLDTATLIGLRTKQAEEEMLQAQKAMDDAERQAAPAVQRSLASLKNQALSNATQTANWLGIKKPENVSTFVRRAYCQLIVQQNKAGQLSNPALVKAAKEYLLAEDRFKDAYREGAWGEIEKAWHEAPDQWPGYYQSRYSALQSNNRDPRKAFATEIVKNATPGVEDDIKQAAQLYLAYNQLRGTWISPFLYPQVIAALSNPFPQPQPVNAGAQSAASVQQNTPDPVMGVVNRFTSSPLWQNMQSSWSSMLGNAAAIMNSVWGGVPLGLGGWGMPRMMGGMNMPRMMGGMNMSPMMGGMNMSPMMGGGGNYGGWPMWPNARYSNYANPMMGMMGWGQQPMWNQFVWPQQTTTQQQAQPNTNQP